MHSSPSQQSVSAAHASDSSTQVGTTGSAVGATGSGVGAASGGGVGVGPAPSTTHAVGKRNQCKRQAGTLDFGGRTIRDMHASARYENQV